MSCTQSLFDSHTTKMEILESRISDQDAEIERLRGELASANLSYLRISDDRDTLRARLDAAIEPGSEEALNMLRCVEYQVEKSLGTPIWWPNMKAKLRGKPVEPLLSWIGRC